MPIHGGFGAKLFIDVSGLEIVAGVSNMDFPEFTKVIRETTGHGSSGGYGESVASGKRSLGEIPFDINWDISEDTHADLVTAFDSNASYNMRVEEPEGDEGVSFAGIVMSVTRMSKQPSQYQAQITIQPSGAPTTYDIYYVDATDGNDSNGGNLSSDAWKTYTNINAGSFNASDKILFKCGETFSGTITIPSAGADGFLIVLGSYGIGAKPILNGGASAAITVTALSRGYWRIRDLDLRCTGNVLSGSRGIYHNVWSGGHPDVVTGWIIEDCDFNCGILVSGPNTIIRNNTVNGSGNSEAKDLIWFRGANATGVNVSGNTIHDGLIRGIWAQAFTDNCIIEDNTIYSMGDSGETGRGINCDGYDGVISGAIVRNNIMYDVSERGIQMENCDGSPQVYGNKVWGISLYGITYGNYAAHDAIPDMRGATTNGVCYNNLVFESAESGIKFKWVGDTAVTHNTLADNDIGLNFESGGDEWQTGVTFFNNLLSHNRIGIRFDAAMTELSDHDYNLYYETPTPVIFVVLNPFSSNSFSDFQTATSKEGNSVEDDPVFVDAANDNYDIQVSSNAKDAGTDKGITTDINGVTRGDPPDIGAYEYVA